MHQMQHVGPGLWLCWNVTERCPDSTPRRDAEDPLGGPGSRPEIRRRSQWLDITSWDPGEPLGPTRRALADTDVAADGADRFEHEGLDSPPHRYA